MLRTLPKMDEILREVSMRRKWQIQRRLQPTADAERRWDRAYQHLLEWTRLDEPHEAPRPGDCTHPAKER